MNSGAVERRSIRFGTFEADLAAGELRKSGVRVKLQEQPFQVLAALLDKPGELVTREELKERLWSGDTFVDFDRGLNTAINKIRETLGDSAQHARFVETVPRHGYRFVYPLTTGRLVESARPPSELPARARPYLLGVWLSGAVLLVTLALITYRFIGNRSPSDTPLLAVRLTSYDGLEFSPTFSPDGSQIAFTWDGDSGGPRALYIKSLLAEEPRRITERSGHVFSPAWSPDGSVIAYYLRRADGRYELRDVPPAGGVDRFLAEINLPKTTAPIGLAGMNGGPLAWSPDGRFLAILETAGAAQAIFLIDVNSREKRQLTFPEPGTLGDIQPNFSNGGDRLAFVRVAGWYSGQLYVLDLDKGLDPIGNPRHVEVRADKPFTWVRSPVWTHDDAEIVFASVNSLWRVSSERGGLAKSLGVGAGWQPLLSRNGQKLAFVRIDSDYDIWELDLGNRQARPLITSTAWDVSQSFSPDGSRIAWSSRRSGFLEIWVCQADGTGAAQLTFLQNESGSAAWSPDGQTIAFDTRVNRPGEIFLIRADGGPLRPLTSHPATDLMPTWSRDGKTIYFSSNRDGASRVWSIPAKGGEAESVSDGQRGVPFVEPNGEFLYFSSWWGGRLFRKRLPDGPETVVLEEIAFWTVGKSGVYFTLPTDDGAFTNSFANSSVIRFLDLKSGQISDVFESKGPVRNLAVSPDERKLLFSRQDRAVADIMLVENFK
jgi:Tol biopolymer transport system component/DNA-binding winged helix-turn-helix (wHTH) protein